jgi:tRNA (guanine37-N1)-methyltransferase
MLITILTLFPEFFESALNSSILKRAQAKDLVQYRVINIRDFTNDKHQTADDRPFGGGPGMVMKPEPIVLALESLVMPHSDWQRRVVLTSAKGPIFTQATAQTWSQLDELVIICGHYEGVDERIAEHYIDQEIRIGDYVLTGGEPAAIVMADAVSRLVPGVLGNEASNLDESHTQPGQLGFPQYTRPEVFRGHSIPEILMSGNHANIATWRQAQKKSADS